MTRLLDQTCDAFLSAPFEDHGWQKALSYLAEVTGSSRAHLLAVGGADEIQFNCLSDTPSILWDEHFKQIDGGNPSTNWRVALAERPMAIMFEDDYDRARQAMACGDYDDFVSHYDMMNGCQTTLHRGTDRFFGLATLRTRGDGRTAEEDRQCFATIAPTVMSAIKLQYALEHQANKIAKGTLEGLDAAAFICDGVGLVSAWTRQADEFLYRSRSLAMRGQRLICRRMKDDARLKHALHSIAVGPVTHQRVTLWIEDEGLASAGSVLEIYRLPRDIGSFDFAPKMVVVVQSPSKLPIDNIHLLRDIFELTHTEADVAIQIANGVDRSTIALARGVSIGTVHSQLKAIFRKMDVGRETELAAKINSFLRGRS